MRRHRKYEIFVAPPQLNLDTSQMNTQHPGGRQQLCTDVPFNPPPLNISFTTLLALSTVTPYHFPSATPALPQPFAYPFFQDVPVVELYRAIKHSDCVNVGGGGTAGGAVAVV